MVNPINNKNLGTQTELGPLYKNQDGFIRSCERRKLEGDLNNPKRHLNGGSTQNTDAV